MRNVTIKLGRDVYAVELDSDGHIISVRVPPGARILTKEAYGAIKARIMITRERGLFVGCIAGTVCAARSISELCAQYAEREGE